MVRLAGPLLVIASLAAAQGPDKGHGQAQEVKLWAAMSVSPIFREGHTDRLQIQFAIVNDGHSTVNPSGSWDPEGHWDINGGKGEPVDHYDPQGNPITPGQAHPGNAPTQMTMWDRIISITPGPVAKMGAAAIIIYLIIDEGSRLYPPRNLVPVP